jgi:hypothetical protein
VAVVLIRIVRRSSFGDRMRRSLVLSCIVLVGFSGGACGFPGDAASRIVNAVRDAADRLRRSSSETIVLSVAPRSWPGGCADGYRVEWRADSDRLPGLGVVCTTGTRGYASIDYRPFVKIPKPLNVTKSKDEPTAIALRKERDGTIAVVALE